jgi:hypothetical protein
MLDKELKLSIFRDLLHKMDSSSLLEDILARYLDLGMRVHAHRGHQGKGAEKKDWWRLYRLTGKRKVYHQPQPQFVFHERPGGSCARRCDL